ncbi:MAG: hypothetical protein FJ144_04680 [Deltaproteobacteria bacterium]|nr:hypothetical protein [Deltaproteobacteria bacterium]
MPVLIGTWTGKVSCKGISDSPFLFGSFNYTDKEATLEINPSGDALLASLSADDPDFAFPLGIEPMCGAVVVDPARPDKARAGLVAGGDFLTAAAFAVDFSTVKVCAANAKGVTGKLTGTGVFISASGLGGNVSSTCKYSLERTSETPPTPPGEHCSSPPPA